jgi:hypothetical protein
MKSFAFNIRGDMENQIYESLDPDIYIDELKNWYELQIGKTLNLENPQTFNEKIQWMKLYDNNLLKTRITDKYLVRDWIKEQIGEEYLTPLLGVWDSFDEIDFDKLPDQFVLKANHGCGWNIIVKNKSTFDKSDAKKKFDIWMKTNYAFCCGFELQYRNIQPKIVAEQYLENEGGDLYDYKIWCFNGKPQYIMFLAERNTELKMAFYDTSWNLLPFVYSHPRYEKLVPRPDNLDKMITLAIKLCQDFSHVRVDFYRLDGGTIKFGEMTFSSYSGICKWDPSEYDLKLGQMIDLEYKRDKNKLADFPSLLVVDSQKKDLELQIQQIKSGSIMYLLSKYNKIAERLLRTGTKRRNYYEFVLSCFRIIITEGWSSFWRKSKHWIQHRTRLPKMKHSESKSIIFKDQGNCKELILNNLKPIGTYRRNKKLQKVEDRPVCIAISLVKNEGDIIRAWLSHTAGIFDRVYVVDHNSSDGTREYLLEMAKTIHNIKLFSFKLLGKFQKEIINQLAELAIRDNPDSWIFPIDADEFLSVESQDQLLSSIKKMKTCYVLEMSWKNIMPVNLKKDEEFYFNTPCFISPTRSIYKKVAIHSTAFIEDKWRFVQGDHGVIDGSGNLVKGEAIVDFGDILHIPIRSCGHFAFKSLQGYLGNDALPVGRKNPHEGFHFLEMINNVVKVGDLTDDIVREIVMYYGQPELCKYEQRTVQDMTKAGWVYSSVNVAHLELSSNIFRQKKYLRMINEMPIKNHKSELEKYLYIVNKNN